MTIRTASSRRQPSSRRESVGIFRVRSTVAGAFAGVLTVVALAGCAQTNNASAPSTPAPAPSAAVWAPGGTAKQNLPAFQSLLQPLTNDDKVPTTQSVVDAVHSVGVTNDQIQVTPDRTPKDLDADNLSVSVKIDDQCLVGQYHRGRFDAVVAAPINGACLVGNTVPLQ
ncbi:hypothetical protein F8O07_05350 [Pseudoclavibacter sp. CFCC 13796]|uniref:DUF6993 domain-containing protein n=1 Tax=Pseudoclavibacter sp. CFCC 13796 TaxID=2615179 RepID=UPI001300FEDB|nr:hypothetical protein [Pseudoclavibacter sp. CFCC 13796]KAB1661355.1 hypothetical protein F8O07_05350 [Pseudoclavibacter sp. CFCC 13796]